jgi:hypothetical protein
MYGTSSFMGDRIKTEFGLEILNERDRLKYVGVVGRIILKCIIEKTNAI